MTAVDEFDVMIIGAGLAGLRLAQLLARSGLRVALADRKRSIDESVHTTGIFVRKTLEDFDLPEDCLGPIIRDVRLYSPSLRELDLASVHDEFRVGRMRVLYDRLLKRCIRSGVGWFPNMRYVTHANTPGGVTVTFDHHHGLRRFETRYLVGADGANSRIAQILGLDRNTEWIVGLEEVFQGVRLTGPPRLHCFIDPRLAPGYIAWVVNDGEETHVGVGGYASRFEPARALAVFQKRIDHLFDLKSAELVDRRGGRIPVNGILKRIANERGLLIGDAAGAVSPLTAGGLDACLRLSTVAAHVIQEFLATSDPRALATYSGDRFRARFVSRLWMRRIAASVTQPELVELACAMLHLAPVKPLARQIFFGRRSFPDMERAGQRQTGKLIPFPRGLRGVQL
jgi:flavin-dependent dehydrogenase